MLSVIFRQPSARGIFIEPGNVLVSFFLMVLGSQGGPVSESAGWTLVTFEQGSFPAGTPGNGVPKVILTLGTAIP